VARSGTRLVYAYRGLGTVSYRVCKVSLFLSDENHTVYMFGFIPDFWDYYFDIFKTVQILIICAVIKLNTESGENCFLMSFYQKAGQKHSMKLAIGPLKMWQSSYIWEQH
jgi:hypothetical protein